MDFNRVQFKITEFDDSYKAGDSYDLAATIETGFGFKIGESFRIYMLGAYNHGFLTQWKDEPGFFWSSQWKNRTASLRFGVQLDF
jgi:hypothetical protein